MTGTKGEGVRSLACVCGVCVRACARVERLQEQAERGRGEKKRLNLLPLRAALPSLPPRLPPLSPPRDTDIWRGDM